jgi:hypothetical protein
MILWSVISLQFGHTELFTLAVINLIQALTKDKSYAAVDFASLAIFVCGKPYTRKHSIVHTHLKHA